MAEAAFIGGDWGTSRLRLFLCDSDGVVLARKEGPGAAAGDCAGVFAELTAEWDAKLPAILCGMVGSTIGWREVPYLQCPAKPEAMAAAALRFEAQGRAISILPGLSCLNPSGAPDVMRGEETQLAGALTEAWKEGLHIFCLPGTHTKWVRVADGAITQFQTALSGELFDILSKHSVLARASREARAEDGAFEMGLAQAERRKADLLHLLFSTRSRQLVGDFPKEEAASYLSGLIIGADVAGAAQLFDMSGPVTLVCTPALAALYSVPLADYGVIMLDGEDMALAGLFAAYRSLHGS